MKWRGAVASRAVRNVLGRFLGRESCQAQDAALVAAAQGAFMIRRSSAARYENLWDTELKVFSQWGEDGILDFLCDALGLAKPTVIELGAGNFTECNSRFLAVNRSASVVAIDARADLVANVRRGDLAWRSSVHALERWIAPENAGEIFGEALRLLRRSAPDVLSVDLDGVDYWVVEALDLDGAQIVVVEYNPVFGDQRAVTVPKASAFDRTVAHFTWLYYGASLPAWVHLLGNRGFAFVGTNRAGNNAFFVPQQSRAAVQVNAIDLADLRPYVQWTVRESRDEKGRLSYLEGDDRIDVMAGMPLVDVMTGEMLTVEQLLNAG